MHETYRVWQIGWIIFIRPLPSAILTSPVTLRPMSLPDRLPLMLPFFGG